MRVVLLCGARVGTYDCVAGECRRGGRSLDGGRTEPAGCGGKEGGWSYDNTQLTAGGLLSRWTLNTYTGIHRFPRNVYTNS